jgi:biotin transporter BioY
MMAEFTDLRELARQYRKKSRHLARNGIITCAIGVVWILTSGAIVLTYDLGSYWRSLIWLQFIIIMVAGIILTYEAHRLMIMANDLESKQDFWATKRA